LIKIARNSTITFGACKFVKYVTKTNIVPIHANAYNFQKNIPKGMLNTIEHASTCFPLEEI